MRIKHPLKFIPLVNIPTKPPSAIILVARQFYTFPRQNDGNEPERITTTHTCTFCKNWDKNEQTTPAPPTPLY